MLVTRVEPMSAVLPADAGRVRALACDVEVTVRGDVDPATGMVINLSTLKEVIRSLIVDPGNPYPAAFTGHIRATLRDGSVVEERQPHFRGGAQEPLSEDAIAAKFDANAAFGGWTAEQTDAAHDMVRGLFSAPVVDLTALRG